jgi:hypothetical protein
VNPQHGRQRVRWPAVLALGVVMSHLLLHLVPRNQLVHPFQKDLAALLVLVLGFGEGYLAHGGGESYAVSGSCIIADFGKLFRGSLMLIYYFIVLVLLLFSPLGIGKRSYVEVTVYWAFVIFLALFAGLRFETGFDYYSYLEWYEKAYSFESILSQVKEPGLLFLFYPFNRLELGFPAALFFVTALSITIKAWVIYRWSNNVFVSLILLVGLYLLIDEMGQVRNALASAIIFSTAYALINRDPKKFFSLYIAATIIHYSSIVFILSYILTKTKKLYSWNFIFFVLSAAFLLALIKPLTAFISVIDLVVPDGLSYKYYLFRIIEENKSRPIVTLGLIWHLSVFFFLRYSLDRKFEPFSGFGTLLNTYFIGIILLITLSESEALAGRTAQPFLIFTIILAPYALTLIRPKQIGFILVAFAITVFSISRMSLTLFGRTDALVPYQSVIPFF